MRVHFVEEMPAKIPGYIQQYWQFDKPFKGVEYILVSLFRVYGRTLANIYPATKDRILGWKPVFRKPLYETEGKNTPTDVVASYMYDEAVLMESVRGKETT